MILLPIVERELRVRARQVGTYRGRWVAVGFALMFAGPMLLANSSQVGTVGGDLFVTLTVLAFIFCLVEGGRQAADCLSSERREGTLGLLFLTDLKGYDVVLGKLVGIALNLLYGLVAIMPVLGLALLAGGVTGGEFGRVTLVLVTTLLFSLATGMCVSARSRDEQKALVGAAVVVAAICGGIPLLELVARGGALGSKGTIALFSPAYACYLAFDAVYRQGIVQFWCSLLQVNVLSCGLLWLAAIEVRKFRQDEPAGESVWQKLWPRSSHGDAVQRVARMQTRPKQTAERKSLLAVNPVLWLANRSSGKQGVIWLMVWLTLVTMVLQLIGQLDYPQKSGKLPALLVISSYGMMVIDFLLWFCLASMVCRFFVEARRTGSIELLLSSPLRDRDILRGFWLNARRIMAGPLFCYWLAASLSSICCYAAITHDRPISGVELGTQLVLRPALSAGGLLLEAMALCSAGLWLSLSMKKPGQAMAATFLYVVVLPWLLCSGFPLLRVLPARGLSPIGPMFSYSAGTMFVHLMLWRWARNKMQLGVRRIALRQLAGLPLGLRPAPRFKQGFFVSSGARP